MADTKDEYVALPPALPAVACDHQVKTVHGGEKVVLCTLPEGECLIQRVVKGPDGREHVVCSAPHSVFTDWQLAHYQIGD